ncbi:MAG TPA: hypothetical protein VF593_06565 [Chthoniobacteraceae bacterium]
MSRLIAELRFPILDVDRLEVCFGGNDRFVDRQVAVCVEHKKHLRVL